MKSRILCALSQTEGYVSGQELCEELKVSRTAVWKVINQIKEEGYEIESIPRRGYRIISRPDLITAEEIGCRLETKWAGKKIYYHTSIDSTNNEAIRMAENGDSEGTLVVAEEQGSGKGRRGRAWMTPAGSAVAMSLVIRPQMNPARISMVTLVMGLAVAYACKDCCDLEVGIKWPNDIVIRGRKICGILTEMSSEIDFIKYVVIGVGINTAVDEFPEELQATATSLHKELGKKPDRARLIAACMKRFEEFYNKFLQTEDFSLLKEDYNALLLGIGKQVRVLEPNHEYNGVSEGINDLGELLVRMEDGTVKEVYAGEVSVRGIYGYV